MSDLTTAARPYARAAFTVATANSEQQEWGAMLTFMATAAQDSAMGAVLDSPGLSRQQVANIFVSVCEGQINESGENFIKLLVENDRITLLPEITALYKRYRANAQGSVDAEVISASDIDEQQLANIAASLQKRLGKKINLSSHIDETLIGGAIIRAGDLVIDGSVRGRLDRLATALEN